MSNKRWVVREYPWEDSLSPETWRFGQKNQPWRCLRRRHSRQQVQPGQVLEGPLSTTLWWPKLTSPWLGSGAHLFGQTLTWMLLWRYLEDMVNICSQLAFCTLDKMDGPYPIRWRTELKETHFSQRRRKSTSKLQHQILPESLDWQAAILISDLPVPVIWASHLNLLYVCVGVHTHTHTIYLYTCGVCMDAPMGLHPS